MKQFIALALLAVAVAANPDAVRFVDSPITPENVADMRPLIVSAEFMRKAAEYAKQIYKSLEVEPDTVHVVDFADEVAVVDPAVPGDIDSVVVADAVDEDVNAEVVSDAVQFVDAAESDDVAMESVVDDEQDAAAEAQDAVVIVDAVEDVDDASDDTEVMQSEDIAVADAVKFVDVPEAQVLVMPEPQLFQRYPGKQFANPMLRGGRQ